MRFLSVCSGIEAASVAWHPLGWRAWGLAEIEAFPSAVLAHHYPTVPNLGDMTKFKDWPDGSIDLLCGGTPCQSFSNAGLRAGLDDPRGQLMLTFGAIAARYRPKWLVWENVPGVLSSNGGRDFGAFLGLLGFLGYGFAYRVLDAQFVRVDGYGRAVPQRRNRVFVVGCLGDWRSAAAVLLERESLRGDSAPRRSAGQGIAAGALAGVGPGSGWRIGPDEAAAGQLIAADMRNGTIGGPAHTLQSAGIGSERGGNPNAIPHVLAYGGNKSIGPRDVASALSAHGGACGRMDFETETFVAHTLRGEGFDAGEDGTGRGTPLVPVLPIDMRQASRGATMTNNRAEGSSGGAPGTGIGEWGDPSPTISTSHPPAVAFGWQNAAAQGMAVDTISPTLDKSKHPATATGAAVRRLMPVECERLMGFPDNYTLVPWRGKPTSECPDGPRYKSLGNSWAVNCARWIGRRIALVEQIERERAS